MAPAARGILLPCLAALGGVSADQLRGSTFYSAFCSEAGSPRCSVVPGSHPSADAVGSFQDDTATSGWGRLLMRTTQGPSEKWSGNAPFAAGYLEGVLTAERVAQHHVNAMKGQNVNPMPAGVREFIESTDRWALEQLRAARPDDAYWHGIRFIYDQLNGLQQGVNHRLGELGQPPLSRFDIVSLNMVWDLDDIKQAVNVSERANFDAMDIEALALWKRQRTHCSSIVKLLPDGSELFAGHNTWMSYGLMLRVWKVYEFGSAPRVAMSSYPGVLSSTDDFYQVDNLAVFETTLPNYNNELFERVKPETLPFWIRAMVANYLASDGPEWMEAFKKHNSGTYNNAWMVVDYSKFTPRQPLVTGVLTVGEQLPGYFHWDDQTELLSYGYWPSYNAAFYPETARLIKQDIMSQTKGNEFSYQLVSRAKIFRRDQAGVNGDEDMQRIMRYNHFQTDPIAEGDPCKQLACRSDLAAVPMAFGAIDAKYTSSAHVRAKRSVVISGPSHDDQAVFDWRFAADGLAAGTSHLGQPQRFDFGWWVMGADMEAEPWPIDPDSALKVAHLGPVAVTGLAMASIVVFFTGFGALWLRRRGAGHANDYKPLRGPPLKSPGMGA